MAQTSHARGRFDRTKGRTGRRSFAGRSQPDDKRNRVDESRSSSSVRPRSQREEAARLRAEHLTPGVGPRQSELLYGATALGLWTFSRSKFQVVDLGASELRLQPGLLLVATHRASGDVPILCGSLYFSSRVWAARRWHLHFVARDEFFERGFLAGYPRHIPPWLRRLVYPIELSGGMSRVRVLPLRSGHTMKLAQMLGQLPADIPLDDVIPTPLVEQLSARAAVLGIAPPQTPRALLRGEFADLLWQTVSVDDLCTPLLAEVWERRRASSREDMRALIDLVRAKQPLLIFPEGRHSPNGEVGPLGHGLDVLVSEGRPDAIAYIALAYDPLTRGRTRVCASFTAPQPPPSRCVEEEALRALKHAMPLTCGQLVAHALVEAAARGGTAVDREALELHIDSSAKAASQAGRRMDPALGDAGAIRRRLEDCLLALARRHRVALEGGSLVFDRDRIIADQTLARLAREYASASELGQPSTALSLKQSQP